MNGKFLLITVLSLATLCLAGPTYKTEQDTISTTNNNNELNSIQDKINYEQKQQHQQQQYKRPIGVRGSSNNAEDILARWCKSSDMSSEILTESFKQLSATLKSASKRQLEQLTEEIIVKERFCQQHPSQSSQRAQDDAQEDLIKDVYLDALVACDSSEAVEQLVRAIDTGKVDKIRSNYYLTLLAISVTGDQDDETTGSTSTNDIAQKLSQSLLSSSSSASNSASSLVEAIERQKMFAATAAWSKKIQRQQEDQGKVSEIYKQQVEQLVEAIFERYIIKSKQSGKQAADRSAALKAIANIPTYAMPAKTVQYLVQLALNKQEQVTVRQTAIEALKDCSHEQEQQLRLDQQLRQLALYANEEPIEVRIAAYRHIGEEQKLYNNLDELVKYIKEEQRERQDTQFVTYMVSHMSNQIRSDKSLYEKIKGGKPQHLAQIRVVAKRMQNAYSDMRKYSRNYQLEQSLAKLDTGLIVDADIIYAKSDVLPKVMRLNISMPVMGKTVDLLEVSVRQNQMEREFLHVLKPLQATKVNIESIENVVSSIKKVANQYNNEQQRQSQQPEADLAIKVDGCTVLYVALDDFKDDQQQNSAYNKNNNNSNKIRSPRSTGGRYQKSSREWSTSGSSFIEQLFEQLKKSQVLNRGLHFHMEKRLGGLIDLQTVLTGGVRAESRLRSLGVQQGQELYELVARLEPRFAFETTMGLVNGPASGATKKLIQRVAHQSSVGLRIKYQEDQLLELLVELPQQEMELFKVESQLVEQVGVSSSGLPIYRYPTEFEQDSSYYNTHYDNQDTSSGNSKNSEWMSKSEDEKEKLMRYYGQDIKDYYGDPIGQVRARRSAYKSQEYSQVFEMPQTIGKLTGLRAKFELVAAPKHLSGMMRLVVKKIDPKMTGYRVLVQSDNSQSNKNNRACTIAISTPVQYGQEQQQERLVQLRYIRAETNGMHSIKGELVTPISEPMRFMVAYKDEERQQALECDFKYGKSAGGKFEIGYQKPTGGMKRDQYIYKPYVRVQMDERQQPIEMSAIVSVVHTPKTSVQYEIQVPQEFVDLITKGRHYTSRTNSNQENKIKGKLTLVSSRVQQGSSNKWASSKARRNMNSQGKQLFQYIQENDLVMTNDLEVQIERLSFKALTHFGYKPQDDHLVWTNNVDYVTLSNTSNQKVEQSRFDFEFKNKQHEQGDDEQNQQIFYINHSNSKYPATDYTVKLAHKQWGKKHQVLARCQYPTMGYIRQVKSSQKVLSMEQRQNEMGRIEYQHELDYVSAKQMQLVAQFIATPIKVERKMTIQVQTDRPQTQSSRITWTGDESIKAQIVVVDKVLEREDVNAYIKFEQISSGQQTKQYNLLLKAEVDNKKHSVELKHDCQHQEREKQMKNLFRMTIDKQAPTTFEYQIRNQQPSSTGKFDYVLEGQWRDAQTNQRPVQVRARTQLSMVDGFEFEHQFECQDKHISALFLVSEPKQQAKIDIKSTDFTLAYTSDTKPATGIKQALLAIQYRPERLQHQTRVQYDQHQQVVIVESELIKKDKTQYRFKNQLASPIDVDYFNAQYERLVASRQRYTAKRSHKSQKPTMTIGDLKQMIRFKKQIPASYIKAEYDQQQVKFALELVPQEERLQVVLTNDNKGLYHQTLIESSNNKRSNQSKMLVIKSETKTDKDQQACLIEAYISEEDTKIKMLVPRFYNMDMDYQMETNKLVAYMKKGAKFERTLAESQRKYPKIVTRFLRAMNKMDSQKVIIDGQHYPQIKLAWEINESPVKKIVVFGADIWANQKQWSSMAMQTPRFAGETKWQKQSTIMGSPWRIESELKDLIKKERYALDGALSAHTNYKSYLNMDMPSLSGQMEYEPQEERARFHMSGKPNARRSPFDFEFESRLERSPIGQSATRFIRRALVNYQDPDEQQKHSFEFNPIYENVKFFSQRQPKTTNQKHQKYQDQEHFWSMEANLNSHRRRQPMSGSDELSFEDQQDLERSYLKLKHNQDFEADFEMRPFESVSKPRQNQNQNQIQNQDRFARFLIKSRAPRSVYEHETKLTKEAKSGNYKAWIKHLSRDELKALFEAEIKSRKHDKRAKHSSSFDDSNDDDDDESYDHYAKVLAKSDKHGRAQWEHKFNAKSKSEPKIRQDRMSFDLDLSDKWNQLKHQSKFDMKRPYDTNKRERRSIGQQDQAAFEYMKDRYALLKKMDARASSKTSYNNQPMYQIEADWNQMYNSQQSRSKSSPMRANTFKANALKYKTEFEYQPYGHAHLQVINPKQERHLTRYEMPSSFERSTSPLAHRFTSKQVSAKGQDMYKFEAQFPTSFDDYEFHPYTSGKTVSQKRQQQPASNTKIMYEDRLGKKFNLDFDLARQNKQKRSIISLEDAQRGYQHQTKWGYSGQSEKFDGPSYFKTETKSTKLGQLLSFDIEARDSKQVLVRFETPLVRGEISGERPQRHQQQVRVKLQNQPQNVAITNQQRRLRAALGADVLPEQFYHDTEVMINERDQYYKLKSQTVVDQQQLMDLMMVTKEGEQSQFKLSTSGSSIEAKFDKQAKRLDFHLDYDQKRVQQDTMIHLKDEQRQVWAIESGTRHQQQQVLDISGELCYDQVRCLDKKTKLVGQIKAQQYKYQLAYDPLIKSALVIVQDQRKQEVHELVISYDEQKDAINMDYVRKANNGTQETLVRGEARLSVRDLARKWYDVEYLDTRRRSTSQQTPMVSEIKLEVAPDRREQRRSLRVRYEPKKQLELNYSDEPNKFQHATKIDFPLAASQKKDTYTQDFGLLMRQVRVESRQNSQYQPELSYQLTVDYDLEREIDAKFESAKTTIQFELHPAERATRSGQLLVASTRINLQSKFDFDSSEKRLMVKSTTNDKLTAIIYALEADLSMSRKQPSLLVLSSPKYQYKMETDLLAGFPTFHMKLDQPQESMRHEFQYRPMDGAHRRHQLKLAKGRLVNGQSQIDFSAPSSSLLDINFDRDNQQESYLRLDSPQSDFYGQLNYKPQEESLRFKYGRPSDKFEHDTLVSHFLSKSANGAATYQYPRQFKSQATRQGRSLYQVYGDARTSKQSGSHKHALGYESHGYEVRASVDPRTHEVSVDITTPENKRQHTEIVMPSRLQPQYQVKSSLKTQEGIEIYSMEYTYTQQTQKMVAQYRQYPNQQYQMEWDGKLKQGHIQSEHLTMDIKATETTIKYQSPRSQQYWTGIVRYDIITPTGQSFQGYNPNKGLLLVQGKFQKSTGEEIHFDMERQLGQKLKLVMKVLNSDKKSDLISTIQANLIKSTVSMKMDYDEEKFEREWQSLVRKLARQFIWLTKSSRSSPIYQFLEHQLVIEEGQQVSQYKVKEISELAEQLYHQVKEECSRINHQSRYPIDGRTSYTNWISYDKIKTNSCQLVEEYLEELEGALVRTGDKLFAKVGQLYEEVPMVKELVKVYEQTRELINKLIEHISQSVATAASTTTNNNYNYSTTTSDSYEQGTYAYLKSVKSNAAKLASIILDPSMYQSHNSRFTMRPGYLAMELAPEKELNLIRGVMAY